MACLDSGREFIRQIAERAANPSGQILQFYETMGTLTFGSLSASLGIVGLVVTVAGILKRPLGEWNAVQHSQFGRFFSLSLSGAFVAFVGLVLGIAGTLISRTRKGMISLVSVFGSAVCYLTFIIALVYVLSFELIF